MKTDCYGVFLILEVICPTLAAPARACKGGAANGSELTVNQKVTVTHYFNPVSLHLLATHCRYAILQTKR